MPAIVAELYEKVTRMHVYERAPYAGALVFAAFSGSHQDAIAKGMKWREEKNLHEWTVPYLPIDPHDVGREYETDVIRINSQSGKGGIGYILEQNYGYDLPPKMREALGYAVKDVSDHLHKELNPKDVYGIFESEFLNKETPFAIPEAHYIQKDGIYAMVTVDGKRHYHGVYRQGQRPPGCGFQRHQKRQRHGISRCSPTRSTRWQTGSTSHAVAYVGLTWADGRNHMGRGPAHGYHGGQRQGTGQAPSTITNGTGRANCFDLTETPVQKTRHRREKQNDGNDNDTEDPGGACRAGLTL